MSEELDPVEKVIVTISAYGSIIYSDAFGVTLSGQHPLVDALPAIDNMARKMLERFDHFRKRVAAGEYNGSCSLTQPNS